MLFSPGDISDFYYRFLRNRRIANPIARAFMSDAARTATWWDATASSGGNWWEIPDVVARWNRMISGDASTPYMRHVGNRYFAGKKDVKLLSIGCGAGAKEIAIGGMWQSWYIRGVDVSASRIEAAGKAAKSALVGNVEFHVGTIDGSIGVGAYDIVLFDSSLHHFTELDALLKKAAAALTDNGVLAINEYVGPDRFQWTRGQLTAANRQLRAIPTVYRRRAGSNAVKKRIYRPGYLRMVLSDPSEAVESSKILPALHRKFSTLEEIALGGNLLHLVLKDIAHHFINPDNAARAVLDKLFAEEERFLVGKAPDFVFGVYRKC